MTQDMARRLTAEGIGTGLVLTAVVGSGIMADRLAGGNVAIALLANTIATAAALVALILTFGPISGAISTQPSPWQTQHKVGCSGVTFLDTSQPKSSAR
jgi:hypothetical protein